MSGGEGLRAPGLFSSSRSHGGRRQEGMPGEELRPPRAFSSGSREVLGRRVFLWIPALD